ncbi:MAG: GDP-L-fucose synthase [Lentisphaerae bacterium]|nr:GDP-L-fucose synthase [Lentisphaerota bacterium]MCP4102176.1 GDP-L-fucose synthase [Lentisphaerota bacterium]
MEKNAKIFIAGHRGMVGSAILRKYQAAGYTNIICKSRSELNLCDQQQVKAFFEEEKPEYVVLAAAKVGGIKFNNDYKAEFLLENLQIQNNVIHQAYLSGVRKLCFLGSSCIYPREAPQPLKEEYLLTGPLEPTNEGYALAKISGYKLGCYLNEQYQFNVISLMPCNLYGTNDHYDPENSHVVAALVRRFCEAADNNVDSVQCWGSGSARREFMHVDDLANAVFMLMNEWNNAEFMNVGPGTDVTIKELSELVAKHAGYKGEINWDTTKPDGMPLKCMDVSRISKSTWRAEISLEEGIKKTIAEYRKMREAGEIRA